MSPILLHFLAFIENKKEVIMRQRSSDDNTTDGFSTMRPLLVAFLIRSCHELQVSPIIKYTSLSLFMDRFYFSLSRRSLGQEHIRTWLLKPMRESNLQLFALASIWISSKIHKSRPFPVQILKSLGDKSIDDQHFTTHDFLEAEVVFLQVLNFEIGVGNVAFFLLEELLIQLHEVAKDGKLVNSEACMDIMDLLYEKEETSILYSAPRDLAASILVASYIITAPKQRWEFPVLPWVKFATSCKEGDIVDTVRNILTHVLAP